jgi:hypothetical protein
MIELEPYKICPFGSFCGYSEGCRGLDEDRPHRFICELWAENYEPHVLKELED